ncbi:Hypothetical Protein FCC1311_102422 [Hondaea fermentalgiana]|uniref:Uncharacterized protein n=1 Tax=Hondaea fermentalgiana TaxID=2315210 RepID=A0A2R5GUL7_9STRA|nr:Hypothetical Protein FCC1311_102422 [Hondaea fermentalgiana]|eukprot:GBG34019.1 Hypothetical Protein FCC1311_102422 [Hondaea fermentalgiana]
MLGGPDAGKAELADASQQFAAVAQQQQRQQQHQNQRQQLELDQERQQRHEQSQQQAYYAASNRPEIETNVEDDELRAKNLSLQKFAFVTFSVFVLGAAVALSVYSLYLGITQFHQDCEKDLATWVIVQGLLGLVAAALLVAITVPEGAASRQTTNGLRRNFFRHRIAPPTFSTSTARGERNRRLVSVLGLVHFVMLCWFIVGTARLAKTSKDQCPHKLYIFVLVYIVVVWLLLLGLCAISVAVLCRKRLRKRASAGTTQL